MSIESDIDAIESPLARFWAREAYLASINRVERVTPQFNIDKFVLADDPLEASLRRKRERKDLDDSMTSYFKL